MRKIQSKITTIIKKSDEIFFLLGSIYFAVSLILFSYFAFNPVFFNFKGKINPLIADQYGSFMGGLFGTLIGVATTFFLLYTIMYQLKTNRKNQIEAAFYKLVDYHKENVNKLVIYGNKFTVEGSEVFLVLQKKFDTIYKLVQKNSGATNEQEIIDISYKLLFFGFNHENIGVLKNKIEKSLIKISFEDFISAISLHNPIILYKGNSLSIKESNEFQLGHYFRNLYNTFLIIDKDDSLSNKEKEFYLKILRTQFSTPEVWIIMLNSLSQLGKAWKDNGYIDKYDVIKNLSEDYSTIIDFTKYYPNILYEFQENN